MFRTATHFCSMFYTRAFSNTPDPNEALNQSSTIKAVLFDVFGTVVDWRGSMTKEFHVFFDQKGISTVSAETFIDEWVKAYSENMSKISEGKTTFATVDELNKISLENTLHKYCIFDHFTKDERHQMWMVWRRLEAWPDSVAGLMALKELFIIGTLSNGNMTLLVDLSKQAKLNWDVILSGELWGRYKPDPFVYQSAAKTLHLKPSEILLVASHKYDLEAARRCGFKPAYIFRPLEYGTVTEEQRAGDNDFDTVTTGIDQLAEILTTRTVSRLQKQSQLTRINLGSEGSVLR